MADNCSYVREQITVTVDVVLWISVVDLWQMCVHIPQPRIRFVNALRTYERMCLVSCVRKINGQHFAEIVFGGQGSKCQR